MEIEGIIEMRYRHKIEAVDGHGYEGYMYLKCDKCEEKWLIQKDEIEGVGWVDKFITHRNNFGINKWCPISNNDYKFREILR